MAFNDVASIGLWTQPITPCNNFSVVASSRS